MSVSNSNKTLSLRQFCVTLRQRWHVWAKLSATVSRLQPALIGYLTALDRNTTIWLVRNITQSFCRRTGPYWPHSLEWMKKISLRWNENMFLFVINIIALLFSSCPANAKTVSGVFRSDAARENNGQYITRFLYHGTFHLKAYVRIYINGFLHFRV